MFKKYLSRLSRPLGQLFFISLATGCIFFSSVAHDIDYQASWFGRIVKSTVSFEDRFYDYRMRQNLDPKFLSKEQVLITVDDYSLEKIGTWPLPRELHAKLLDKLKKRGAKVVAMDILFPETSRSCGADIPDDKLAYSFKHFGENDGKTFISFTTIEAGNFENALKELPSNMYDFILNSKSHGANLKPRKIDKFTFPNKIFASTGVGLGTINNEEDFDGIFRHYLLVSNVDDLYFGSLGLNAFDAFVDVDQKSVLEIQNDGTAKLKVGKDVLELNNKGETKIRYVGSYNNFPNVSYADFIDDYADEDKMTKLVKGKIVFVGSTALGAHDLRSSPVDSKMPGVMAHMNIVHSLLHKHFYKPNEKSFDFSFYLLFLGMAVFFFVQRLAEPTLELVTLIVVIAASFYADRYYFLPQGYELKLTYTYACFIFSYSWNTYLNFSETNKEKKQIKGTFARYVAPTIVDEMLKDPEKLVVGGFRRDITCLFSDVRDFTSISEGLTPQELAHSLNMYMGHMTDIVLDTKGTLDKYIGDAIVAFWGAPLEIGNHAQYAVEGAIKMMDELPSINEQFRKLGRPEFQVGIGLNSGECNVGNMGSDRIFSYTALGDNMNLGARLESLCKHYGVQILISEYTLARIDTKNIKYRPIDNVVVKGKKLPVAVFEILHANHFMVKDPTAYETFNASHERFMNKEFEGAMAGFNMLYEKYPNDKASKRFYELNKKFFEHPELVTDQFHITVMTEKSG